MRQIGTLNTARDARRLLAFLLAERIEAQAEEDGGKFALWIRDEDQVGAAREALAAYEANPDDPRFEGKEQEAQALLREEEQRRRNSHKNVVDMSRRWGAAGPGGTGTAVASRRCPLVLAMIGVSVMVALFSSAGDNLHGSVMRALMFADPGPGTPAAADQPRPGVWSNVARGQVWRLITPSFIHFGLPHLIFNVIWLYIIGGQIENRRGTPFFALFVLAAAALSNAGQAQATGIAFGGLSGVGYAVFGYMLTKVWNGNDERYYLSGQTIFLGLVWFVLCILRSYGPFRNALAGMFPHEVANVAHAAGLFFGIAVAYAPLLRKRSEG